MSEDLFDKKVECPICNSHFTSKKIRNSKILVKKRYPDYYTEYGGENPTYYAVFVCPVCGYSAFEKDFNCISEMEKQIIIQRISIQWKGKNYTGNRSLCDAIEVYKLALLSYDLRNYKSSVIGKVALRLSWFYRELGNNENEKYYQKIVLEKFKDAFVEERLDENKEEELVILYLIGELLRQERDYKSAIKWYDKVLKDPEIKRKRHLEQRVRNQWSLAREMYVKEKGGNII